MEIFNTKKYYLESICWWIINITLAFTFILKQFTFLSNIALLILLICRYRSVTAKQRKYIIISGLSILILSSYSIIFQNSIPNIIRFSLILFFICTAYFIKLPRRILIPPLKITALSLSILIIIAEIYFLLLLDKSNLPSLRYFFTSNELGDIYLKYNIFYAIQLVGTAAIPFIFMLSFVYDSLFPKHKWLNRGLLLSGVILAGNFGFLLAITCFLFCIFLMKKISYRSLFNKFIMLSVFLIFIGPYIINFVSSTLESKKEVSNAIRIDQTTVLLNDMSDNIGTSLFGTGLGHTINIKTKFRDYTDNVYYELQTLYFFNQMGIVFFLIFIILNIYLSLKYIVLKKLLLLYLSYILYAITNPYILNTNQVVVIITLVSLYHTIRMKKRHNLLSLHNYEK